ncbi:tRNA (guanine-N(7)-)-methyltransferase non-catalytic subunit wdr4-like [Mya arenaria]|uniref:tRNA (guanine-N(7)-)-methyltransferase non-catalytic subunit wdr4-like n=1 Tax=Mya arenaria TaxID=6604 RepID=UPI0022E03375|nr:tRNA (guanine-N(7)-)-methyltransferase non-catalytic subunit wdr4-like [Mya arenaria]
MAMIRAQGSRIVVICGDVLLTFCNGVEDQKKLPVKKNAKTQDKDEDTIERDCPPHGDGKQKITTPNNCALAAAFSKSGNYFAVADDFKQLHVYKTGVEYELLCTRPIARRGTAVAFPDSEAEVVVADRTGDVYQFSMKETQTDGQLILGHLSMVLDLCFVGGDEYIVTCDRDEKVRISCYPNSYNIRSYCLYHTEYVSQLLYLEDRDLLVSGSGDDRLAFWDIDGNLLYDSFESDVQTDTHSEPLGVKRLVYDAALSTIAVLRFKSTKIQLYTISGGRDGLSLKQQTLAADDSLTLGAHEPWDVCFDGEHNLWVLQACETCPVRAYTCTKLQDSIVVGAGKLGATHQNKLDSLNSKWELFKGCHECGTPTISLQKQRTQENVQKYLERKEERIHAQKNKPTLPATQQSTQQPDQPTKPQTLQPVQQPIQPTKKQKVS